MSLFALQSWAKQKMKTYEWVGDEEDEREMGKECMYVHWGMRTLVHAGCLSGNNSSYRGCQADKRGENIQWVAVGWGASTLLD